MPSGSLVHLRSFVADEIEPRGILEQVDNAAPYAQSLGVHRCHLEVHTARPRIDSSVRTGTCGSLTAKIVAAKFLVDHNDAPNPDCSELPL
ncbi:hypothetical protein SPHINGO8AM_130316 [Sphingomonas sp. 8AM]|nr:hypothetical protein SPHINGO8AM_130316 [Sphingomonas sp. 8AM]